MSKPKEYWIQYCDKGTWADEISEHDNGGLHLIEKSAVTQLKAELRYTRTVLKGVLISTQWLDFEKRFNKVEVK